MNPGVSALLTAKLAVTAPDFAAAVLETVMMLPDKPDLQWRCLRSEMARRFVINKSSLTRDQIEWLVDILAAGRDDLGDLREDFGRRYKWGWAGGGGVCGAVASATSKEPLEGGDARFTHTRDRVSGRINEARLRQPKIGTLSPEAIKKAAPLFATVAHLWAEHFRRGETYGDTIFPCPPNELGAFVANALEIKRLAEVRHTHARAGRGRTIMKAGLAIDLPKSFVDALPPANLQDLGLSI